MTAQIKEIMIIENEKYTMHCTPLESYLNILPTEVKFNYRTTACWRGYIGTWHLKNEKLYLINLKGTKYNSESCILEDVGLNFLFHEQEKVFANWFTGMLTVPQGDILTYCQDNYIPYYEHTLHLKFENGILIDFKFLDAMEKFVDNIYLKKSNKIQILWKKLSKHFKKTNKY